MMVSPGALAKTVVQISDANSAVQRRLDEADEHIASRNHRRWPYPYPAPGRNSQSVTIWSLDDYIHASCEGLQLTVSSWRSCGRGVSMSARVTASSDSRKASRATFNAFLSRHTF